MRTRFPFTLTALLFSLVLTGSLSLPAQAVERSETQIVVQPVPVSTSDINSVSADRTPSGFAVPRYVSLKFGKVNARTGPSHHHPVAYQYRRRGLPLIVVAETEMWRKVRDIDGDEAWLRKPALSGKRFAVLTAEAELRSKVALDSRRLARIEGGALVALEHCEAGPVCRVRTSNGLKGYALRALLWGAEPLDSSLLD